MSDGRDRILRRSAQTINKALAGLIPYPEDDGSWNTEERSLVKDYNRHRPYGPAPKLCYAPFSSLFFNTEGQVLACCKNTRQVLGRIPQDRLSDIWKGARLQQLREHLLHHDLSLGCYKCREALRSGNYGSMSAQGFDFLRAYRGGAWPRLLEFELSNRCNLECAMCSGRVSSSIRKNREGRETLESPYDQHFTDQLDAFIPHLKQARFYGGEPFLIDLYYDIWERIIARGPSVDLYVLTNGTILNDRVKDLMARGNFTVHVSVDSFRKETYESIRIGARYEQTMENLQYFIGMMKARGKKLCIYVTPTRLNWREMPEVVQRCSELGTDVYFSTAWFPEHLSIWNLPTKDLQEILAFYREAVLPDDDNRQRFGEMVRDVEHWLQAQLDDPEYVVHFLQHAASQEFAPEGELQVIRRSELPLYREMLTMNLAGETDSDIQAVRETMGAIDALISAFGLDPVLVYFYLKDVDPAGIRERLATASAKENAEFLKTRQEHLLQQHLLVP